MDELITVNNPLAIPPKGLDEHGHLPALPLLLAGTMPGQVRERTVKFFLSVADIFESWVARRTSPHTQRAYRQDVMAFIAFMRICWPAAVPGTPYLTFRS